MAIAMRKSERNKKNTDRRTPFSDGRIADHEIVYSPSLEIMQGLFSVFEIIFYCRAISKRKAGGFAPAI